MDASQAAPAGMPWVTARGLGHYGERMAARYLRARGLQVLETNWRCDLGEIDIVAQDGTCLVVCEVKTRRSTSFGAPIEAIDHRKLARLRRLAAAWLMEHRAGGVDTAGALETARTEPARTEPARIETVRVDVIGVLLRRGAPCQVEHVVGVVS